LTINLTIVVTCVLRLAFGVAVCVYVANIINLRSPQQLKSGGSFGGGFILRSSF
jgi:hypothetical protein